MKVFRDYDQAALDAQYNLREAVPDAAEQVAFRKAESARVRATAPCRLDIVYGQGPAGTLDVFPPIGEDGAPAVVYIHGGYWHLSDKSDTSYIAPALTEAGIAFITLNYALAPAVGIDEIVSQIRSAIAFVWRNAADLGIDRDRICLAGHSAGGHLTAMAAATDWREFGPDLPLDPFKAACALSGLYDMEPIRLCYLNEVLGLDRAASMRNSPINLAPTLTGPIITAVGADETDEYLRHQAALIDRWRLTGADVRAMEIPGTHHYSIVRALADPDSALCRALTDLVNGTAEGEGG